MYISFQDDSLNIVSNPVLNSTIIPNDGRNCNSTDYNVFPKFHQSLSCQEITYERDFIVEHLPRSKTYTILRGTFGIISILSSLAIIWMLLRSHDGLSTPYHRILLGMCISDILYSLSLTTFNFTTPEEHDYWIWNAHGNSTTCDIQGTINDIGLFCGLFYICSKCIYHVLVVKYQIPDDEIQKRFEPYFHGIPLLCAIIAIITPHISDGYEMNQFGTCKIIGGAYTPHCKGYGAGEVPDGFTIPCDRSSDVKLVYMTALTLAWFVTLVMIIVCMTATFKAVKKQELTLNQYGAAAIVSAIRNSATSSENQPYRSKVWLQKLNSMFRYVFQCEWNHQRSHSTEPTHIQLLRLKRRSQSRDVAYRGLAYSTAFLMSFVPTMIINIIKASCGLNSSIDLDYLAACTQPVQGFFNFLVFMYPRVQMARRLMRNSQPSWWRAFVVALQSKGHITRRRSVRTGNRRRSSTIQASSTPSRHSYGNASPTKLPRTLIVSKKRPDKIIGKASSEIESLKKISTDTQSITEEVKMKQKKDKTAEYPNSDSLGPSTQFTEMDIPIMNEEEKECTSPSDDDNIISTNELSDIEKCTQSRGM